MEPGHARVLSTFPSRPCDRPSDGSPEVMFDRVILTNIRHHARLPRRPELEAALTSFFWKTTSSSWPRPSTTPASFSAPASAAASGNSTS